MRRIIRKLFRKFGFQRKIAPDFVDVMKSLNINVVFDVGANDGAYGREIRDAGYKELIVSFEPNPIAYNRLLKRIKKDTKWFAFQLGLGESDGHGSLSVSKNDVMSSFKSLTKFGLSKDTETTSIIEAKILTLDSFLKNHPEYNNNIYLKIDTQGFEMEVLRGALNSLDKISVIQAEVALVHSYVDQLDWLDFIFWMRSFRYELATAICNSKIGAQVREFDFVFTKRN